MTYEAESVSSVPGALEIIQPLLNRPAEPALESVASQQLKTKTREEHVEAEEARDGVALNGRAGSSLGLLAYGGGSGFVGHAAACGCLLRPLPKLSGCLLFLLAKRLRLCLKLLGSTLLGGGSITLQLLQPVSLLASLHNTQPI